MSKSEIRMAIVFGHWVASLRRILSLRLVNHAYKRNHANVAGLT